ncbi:MAG: hemolysin III family protein [Fimbriimonas sp.]|nr:hemolysin III family protein [Fimbriimonas sp.]
MAKHRLKDPFSAISHYVGATLAVIGLVYLLFLAWRHSLGMVVFTVYGLCLTWLYVASSVYHSVNSRGKWLQRLDHMAIYLVIAGTYTPLCLLAVRGTTGYAMLAAEWTMALIGILANVLFGGGPKWLRLVLYLAMGWLIVIDIPGFLQVLPTSALWWMLAGGLAYTGGTIIYATNRPKLWPGIFGAHDLWHLFVLGGSACHYVLMLTTAHVALAP